MLAIAGAAFGMVGVVAVAGMIQEMLYGVRPLDGMTLFAAAGLVGIVALGAAAVPVC